MKKLLILSLCILAVSKTFAGGPLEVGDAAIPFKGLNESGDQWSFPDQMRSEYLVLYFYPAAFTGGCTKQACAYRDNMSSLIEEGIEVVGISGDDHTNLSKFKSAHNLNFTLVSDKDGKIAGLFGVPMRDGGTIQREIGGEQQDLVRYVTTSRWTVIIGPDKKLIYKNPEVNAAEDSRVILDFVREFKGN